MEEHKYPKVFISYSHVDDVYEQKILGFADKLRSDYIDADIDLYNSVPSEDWPRWMESQIMNADFVIVVCSESYWKKCYDTHGKGVTWEINMVYQRLYDEHCDSTKYIPVIWNKEDDQYILLPLRPYTHYNIGTDEGYEGLKRHIKGIPKYAKPEFGKPDSERYLPLPEKKVKTMFFSTPIDLDMWNEAHWKGMVYLISPDASSPPVLGLLFLNYDAGVKIFDQWKNTYQGKSPDDYMKITYIVPPLPKECYVYSDPKKSYGNGYFVHIGVNEDKAIERAAASGIKHNEMLLTFISRYIWVDEVNGSWNRDTFFKQLQKFREYSLIPIGLKNKSKGFSQDNIKLGYEHGLKLRNAYSKRGMDIKDNDQCKVVLNKAIGDE